MKLAVVTPRYGTDVVGGAETAARLLATRLAARPDWDVEVLTTDALDAATWLPHFEPGTTTEDGVAVRRFHVEGARQPDFDALTQHVLTLGRRATSADQARWLEHQGPVAPALVDALHTSDADVFAFHPYLYHPTVAGLPLVADRAVLHPATHDEAVVKLPLYRDVFTGAGGLAYWSDPERRLTERLFPVAGKPELVVGLGVEPGTGDSAMARAALGLDDRPFVLCLGRVDDGKGVRVLAECFAAYKARRPGPLALLFAGPVVHAPPAHPDIVVAGVVAESVKWGLLRGTVALISPSAFESFSIVLMEAWVVGTPALVNDRCAVTREHALRSGGGLTFADYAEFEVALDRVSDGTGFGAALGEAGRRHVERHFRWPEVLDRYDAFLRRAATRHT